MLEQNEKIVFENPSLTQQEEIAERLSDALATHDYILAKAIEVSATKIGAFITLDGHIVRVEIAARCQEKEVLGGYSLTALDEARNGKPLKMPRLEGFS